MISDRFNYEDIPNEHMINPQALSFYKEGVKALHNSDFKMASSWFAKAIGIDCTFYNAYLQKHYALKNLDNSNHSLTSEIIKCLDKCIEFGPKSAYPYLIKGSYFQSLKKYIKAIEVFKQGMNICSYEISLVLEIAHCYKLLGEYNEVIKYYEITLDKVIEYSFHLNNIGERILGLKKIPSKTKYSTISSRIVPSPQFSTFIADICAEYSAFMAEIGMLSKSYQLISKAIVNSKWDDYIEQRMKLTLSFPDSIKTPLVKENLYKDYSLRKKLGGLLWENNNLYLYNILKDGVIPKSQRIPINLIAYIFNDKPLSIIQWGVLNKKIHDVSSFLLNEVHSIVEIKDFIEYLGLIAIKNDKRDSLFMTALIHYYLGGTASSFMLFDDEFDICFDYLSARESYFYSKLSKDMGIDFIQINSFGIAQLERTNKTHEDYFFLGMMYLLDMNREKAIDCFRKSTSYKYSRLMLYICANIAEYENEILMFNIFRHKKIVDINNGIEQFMDYFILRECYSFLPLSYIQNNSNCPCPMPLWEAYIFQDDLKIEISNEIIRIQLLEGIQNELTQFSDEWIMKKMDKLVQKTGLNSSVDISIQKIAYLISECNISQEDVISLSTYLYANHSINVSEFININMYCFYISRLKFKNTILRTIVFAGCAFTSYWHVLLGIVFSSAFYFIDSSMEIGEGRISFSEFSKNLHDGVSHDFKTHKLLELLTKSLRQ